jgi:hypothetical protein
MTKAELRAQGVQALAETSKPVTKLPMKIKRQCGSLRLVQLGAGRARRGCAAFQMLELRVPKGATLAAQLDELVLQTRTNSCLMRITLIVFVIDKGAIITGE